MVINFIYLHSAEIEVLIKQIFYNHLCFNGLSEKNKCSSYKDKHSGVNELQMSVKVIDGTFVL